MQEFKRFIHDDSGPELIEWAVVTVILLLATVLILGGISRTLTSIYNEIYALLTDNVLTDAAPDPGG